MSDTDFRRVLELVEALKQVAADFARREETLTRSLEARRSGIAWRHEAAISGEEEALAAAVADTEKSFQEDSARVREMARERAGRARRIAAQALRNVPRLAREARGNWLANLQNRLMEAESRRTAALQAADAEAAATVAKLTEDCRRLIALKRETRNSFAGYPGFRRKLRKPAEQISEAVSIEMVGQALTEAGEQLAVFRQFLVPRIFQYLQPPVLAALCLLAGAASAHRFGMPAAAVAASVLLAISFALHAASRRRVERAADSLGEAVRKADRIYETMRVRGTQMHEEAVRSIQEEHNATHAEISGQWERVDEVESDFQLRRRAKIEKQGPALLEKIREQGILREASLAAARQEKLTILREESASRREEAARKHEAEKQQWELDQTAGWGKLEVEWKSAAPPIYVELIRIQARLRAAYPEWQAEWIENWKPPGAFPAGAKFADLQIDVETLAGAVPKDPRLALPGPAKFSMPLALSFPGRGSILVEAKEQAVAAASLNALVLRLLAVSPPGKAAFTIIDPIGLGQNFAGLMYLADYDDALINRRIWTQQAQIEERLAELNEHIEKMIQMYLRNEYATITEYNEKAGAVAEKYHFLVVAGFPAQFSELAARRLQSIAASGARCGVFTLIHWDPRQTPPDGLAIDELRAGSVCIERRGGEFLLAGQPSGTELILESPPGPELEANLVHQVGRHSVDSNRVQVPFAQIAPAPDAIWTGDTTQEVKVAIGRTGATKPQYLAIGKGTRQHALFAGKTGSGKSTLFHVIITNLALSCSPRQVEFYLIDFKKGVEFKCYAEKRLPHARVVAIESDREFALSVLQRVDDELRRRGDLFRKMGVQDVAGYKRAGGAEDIPRTLLIIDEFQEFFVEDDAIAQNASLLFDRLVRQGRAFGIHVLLGSQTLGGAYTLARATLGQMVIRVALQCNEADAYLIMDDNNSAPRLLSRPGEGIYNDAAGAIEGNSPFQVVWLSEQERDAYLDQVHALAVRDGLESSGPIVFEGNAPADIGENRLIEALLESHPAEMPQIARAWLGSPNSIKGPTEVEFRRQSGSHLLMVGQREEAALSMLGFCLLALGAQHPAGKARFVFFQGTGEGAGARFVESVARALPGEARIVNVHDAPAAMRELGAELRRRMGGGAYDAGPMFVFLHGLQKFKKLRREDEFSFSTGEGNGESDPAADFEELIREGSAYGIHLLVTVDAYNNVARYISRKALSEFEMRIVFQMSANDSASLIDSPRASTLGLHRALFFNEREGSIETFRPYALPGGDWTAHALEKLSARPAELNGAGEKAAALGGLP